MEGKAGNKTNRSSWIDLFRGILMCLVYLYHSEVFYGDQHLWSWIFTPIFLTGFFFISGFLFCKTWDTFSLRGKIKQILRSIVFPYFVFMLAFLLPKIFLLHYDPSQTLIDIFLLRASWFVIAIGVVQTIFAITLRLTRKTALVSLLSLIYILIGLGFVSLYQEKPSWMMTNAFLHSNSMPGCWPACINLAFLASPFFAVGIFYRKYTQRLSITISWGFGIAAACLYFVLVITDHYTINSDICFASCEVRHFILIFLYFLLATIALIPLTKKIGKIKLLNYIGANSITFYFLNILMLRIAGKIYNTFVNLCHLADIKESLSYTNYVIVTIIAIFITVPIVWFINRYIPIITGNKEAFRKWSKKLHVDINL